MTNQPDKTQSDRNSIIESFRNEIARQEEIVYGTALFYECVSLLHLNHQGIVETNRKQFRNIIQKGRDMIQRATKILAEAEKDSSMIKELTAFRFTPCDGHAKPAELAKRAEMLAKTYNSLFPDRPRSQAFSNEETLRLMEEASIEFN
ncbi:MAG: hypothetical protein JXN60_02875 [Lentisphaerae bacterium]|nr:hypothetical protein [Lentisphaerota bacterium]